MSDLEGLDEALAYYAKAAPFSSKEFEILRKAARAYRDLLANGQVEPDYEAAAGVYANHRPGVGPVTDRKRVGAIVDAAIGDRLLIEPEEER